VVAITPAQMGYLLSGNRIITVPIIPHQRKVPSEHRLRGFDQDGPRMSGSLSRFMTGATRLLVSGALAFTIAGFLELSIYQSDIAKRVSVLPWLPCAGAGPASYEHGLDGCCRP
jgi:hypothetical protein